MTGAPKISPERIAELRKLADAATDGPWVEDDGHVHSKPACEAVDKYIQRLMADKAFKREQGDDQKDRPWTEVAHCSQEAPNFEADAAFIAAAARTAVPELLDAYEALQAERDRMQASLQGIAGAAGSSFTREDLIREARLCLRLP